MTLILVGLVGLYFMGLSWTQGKVGRAPFEGSAQSLGEISPVESDIGTFLFQLMDEQITKDRKVTPAEYFKLWFSADSNKDNHVSTQEVNMFLKDHLLGPSLTAERIFGEADLTNGFGLTITFVILDTNNDKILRPAEFYSAYMALQQKNVGSETTTESFRGISSEDNDIGFFLFQLMDQEIKKDKKVTLAEYFAFWSRADSNKDQHVSTQEVNTFLKEHLLGPSSYAEQLFGETDLTNALSLLIPFRIFDTNDNIIKSDEFYNAYTRRSNTSLLL